LLFRQRFTVVGAAFDVEVVPFGDVCFGVAGRAVVADQRTRRVQRAVPVVLFDAVAEFTVDAVVGVVRDVVEAGAVRLQRRGDVAPRVFGCGRGYFHRFAARVFPRDDFAVQQFDAVLQRAELQRHAAAVATTGGADLLPVDDAFVGEFAEQRLHVA